METMQILNELASLVNLLSTITFYVFIFGKSSSMIYQLPIHEQWIVRLGLSTIAVGCLYNVLIVSYPPNNEIFINLGYAILFGWAVYFHYRKFVKLKK